MRYVFSLGDYRTRDVQVAGGKAANLNRLIQENFEVPAGFVVSTAALEEFLEVNGLKSFISEQLAEIEHRSLEQVQEVAGKIRASLAEGEIPPLVLREVDFGVREVGGDSFAVRSSAGFEDGATASWAGQFESFLGVEPEDVAHHLRACWASLFGWRAIQYNPNRYRDSGGLRFGVIVQRMVDSKVSGVAFSLDPGTGKRDRIVIEAIEGFGDRLVQGREMPFSAVMDKQQGILLRAIMQDQRKGDLLTSNDLRRLSELVGRIEHSFGEPVDVEWSIDPTGIKILQARAITALRESKEDILSGGRTPNILDYELTFKVAGLSFLFSDMLIRGFRYLRPLFICDKGDFRQYFPNERMEYAAREGYRWLSLPGGFAEYRERFTSYHKQAEVDLGRLSTQPALSDRDVLRAFRILAGLLRFYSKMDFQFTNLTFLYSAENKVIRDNLGELARFKDYARVWVNRAVIEEDSLLMRFVRRLASQLEISESLVQLHKIGELSPAMMGIRMPESELRGRAESYTMFVSAGAVEYLSGEASRDFIRGASRAEARRAEEGISGQVANGRGEVIHGRVRIINVDYGDLERMTARMERMQEEEILVAEFTAPELMMACRKARAIVTDLGGMLSHAAIVSRELGIPCIVGTRHATVALSDGDRVEVDLNSGAVRRL